MLISGNHTRHALWDTRKDNVGHTENTLYECLIIPQELIENLSDGEINMIGNNLNIVTHIGQGVRVEDAVKECFGHYIDNQPWDTDEMRRRWMNLGLKKTQWKTVREHTKTKIQNKQWEDAGMVVYNYKDVKEHRKRLELQAERFVDDDTFVWYGSSGNPHLYRINEDYINEQLDRVANGLKPKTKMKLVVYHTSIKSEKEWKGLFEKMFRTQHLPLDHSNGHIFTKDNLDTLQSLIVLPPATYHEMPMKGKSVQVASNKKSNTKKVS
jgi:hypothetical protein